MLGFICSTTAAGLTVDAVRDPTPYKMETTRSVLADEAFKNRDRVTDIVLTRVRQLPFAVIVVLRKRMTSLQTVVNDAMTWLGDGERVLAGTRHIQAQRLHQAQHGGDGEHGRWGRGRPDFLGLADSSGRWLENSAAGHGGYPPGVRNHRVIGWA